MFPCYRLIQIFLATYSNGHSQAMIKKPLLLPIIFLQRTKSIQVDRGVNTRVFFIYINLGEITLKILITKSIFFSENRKYKRNAAKTERPQFFLNPHVSYQTVWVSQGQSTHKGVLSHLSRTLISTSLCSRRYLKDKQTILITKKLFQHTLFIG